MNQGKYVYSQIIEFLPQRVFDRFVDKYDCNKYVKHFRCWNQLLCMIFGQLTSRDSLRDLIVIINAHSSKSYRLGFGKKVTRSNLAKANLKRNCKIFKEFAYCLIAKVRRIRAKEIFQIKGQVYAFDSRTIELYFSFFWLARFVKTKSGIKLHTLLDLNTENPAFMHITAAHIHDMNVMDFLLYESGAYYIFDRGYVDYARLYKITLHSAFFVIRAKKNLRFTCMYSSKCDKSTGVTSDQIGKLSSSKSFKEYPEKLRRIKFYDQESDRNLVFLTNNFELSALQVAYLYKKRWQIEVFFKWVKQHLKVKSFWGQLKMLSVYKFIQR
jgi:hypothetical protein